VSRRYLGPIKHRFAPQLGRKAALSDSYGVAPGALPTDYEAALRGQLKAAGASQEAAAAEVKWLDDRFASYVVPKDPRRSQTK
jgi:hypothetical protein